MVVKHHMSSPAASQRCEFRILMRGWRRIAVAALSALLAACSAAAPSATPPPTPTPAPTPTLAPSATSTPRTTGLLVNEPEAFEGYTLYSSSLWDLVYLIDNQGRVIHAWPPVRPLAKLLDNGNLLTSGNKEVDTEGNVVWRYDHLQHHDLLKMPNGNALILSRLLVPRDEALDLGANPALFDCANLRALHIVEVRPTGPTAGEIVWEWSPIDHLIQDFDPEKPNYGVVAERPELIDVNYTLPYTECDNGRAYWMDANALDYNAERDQIMITARKFSEVWIIDHSTSTEESAGRVGGNAGRGGGLLYRWGNPRAHQMGTLADQSLFWPHNAHWIPEGHVGAGNALVFSNGNEYLEIGRGYSSVDEIALPVVGHRYRMDVGSAYKPNERVWRYVADPPHSFYTEAGGSAQRLPNGNTLITESAAGRIFEVTRESKKVWEFVNSAPGDNTLYRAYRYAPDHPGIREILTRRRAAYRAAVSGEPAARSRFDVYATDRALTYVKEPCEPADTEARFFLHLTPLRADDLPEARRSLGSDNRDFDFFPNGTWFDDKCIASVPLPDYPVSSVRTGQFVRGEGGIWSAEFDLSAPG